MKDFPQLFSMLVVEDIEPALLHGDLWGGNIGFDPEGKPIIFDPACYYGHNEAEFGIMRLFGGFDSTAFEAYYERIPRLAGENRPFHYR